MMAWEKLAPTPADIPQLVAHAESVRYDFGAKKWVGDLSQETARAILKALIFAADDLTRSIPAVVRVAGEASTQREQEAPPRTVSGYASWLADEITERDQVATTITSAATLAGQATGAAYVLFEYVASGQEAESRKKP
ncbi:MULTISPECIES: hypothetical protein [unclassified Guyparkeria]|uniref:hypothetical protein n=1 Tax=unclassified Guyparkeria TaxID=2626246 RepID=UPI000733833B|nr:MULTISPECIES: hypothetical protein [unclassified Guyparkeria]KTG17749.1 hypothetical protein AUR63_06395 [Guyparkeria sp. XI15]OAE89460.1 hypothetical protein AWR35_06405 [Guyparkeria sp. WRN-7]